MSDIRESQRPIVFVVPKEPPQFSQASIEALRQTRMFDEWNREFEKLKSRIGRQVSPRDIRPIVKAGANYDQLLTWLAFAVYDSDQSLSDLMAKRRSLRSLADQLVRVTNHAARLVNDPQCDGQFWLALESGQSWDLVRKAGVLEANVLEDMRALAQLIKGRGNALGQLSRQLKQEHRKRGMRGLLSHICLYTRHSKRNFDNETAYLLAAAYKAAGKNKDFTADQIKKFRQRYLRNLGSLNKSQA